MPGPLDYLKQAKDWATTPLVEEDNPLMGKPAQDYLDSPSLSRPPMEARIAGFGAGALEGLRGLTTPLDLAGMAAGAAGGARSAMGRMAPYVAETASSSPYMKPLAQVVEGAQKVGQRLPNMGEVDDIIGGMKYNLAKVPSSLGSETGKISPEMAILGGGAAAGLGAYGKQAYEGLKGALSSANEQMNPFHAISQKLQGR